LPPSYGSA